MKKSLLFILGLMICLTAAPAFAAFDYTGITKMMNLTYRETAGVARTNEPIVINVTGLNTTGGLWLVTGKCLDTNGNETGYGLMYNDSSSVIISSHIPSLAANTNFSFCLYYAKPGANYTTNYTSYVAGLYNFNNYSTGTDMRGSMGISGNSDIRGMNITAGGYYGKAMNITNAYTSAINSLAMINITLNGYVKAWFYYKKGGNYRIDHAIRTATNDVANFPYQKGLDITSYDSGTSYQIWKDYWTSGCTRTNSAAGSLTTPGLIWNNETFYIDTNLDYGITYHNNSAVLTNTSICPMTNIYGLSIDLTGTTAVTLLDEFIISKNLEFNTYYPNPIYDSYVLGTAENVPELTTTVTVTINPTIVFYNTSVNLSVAITGPYNNTNVTLGYYKNGILTNQTNFTGVGMNANLSLVFPTAWSHYDNLTFGAKVYNNVTGWSIFYNTTVQVSNYAPETSNLTANTTTIYYDTNVNVSANVIDRENAIISIGSFRMYKNGALTREQNVTNIQNNTFASSVFSGLWNHHDNLSWSFQAYNNNWSSSIGTSNITVLNYAPNTTIPTLRIAINGTLANCTNGTSSDKENDTLTFYYRFYNDTSPITSFTTNNTYNYTYKTSAICEIYASDGNLTSIWYNSSVAYTMNINNTIFSTNCSAGVYTLNFSFFDEDYPNVPLYGNGSMEISLVSWDPTPGNYFQVSFSTSFNKSNTFAICLQPQFAQLSTNATIIYRFDGFYQRNYYLIDVTLSNITYYLSLGVLNTTYDGLARIYVESVLGEPYDNAYVKIDRFYPESASSSAGAYKTIAMIKTTDVGDAYTYLKYADAYYRFIVQDGSTILKTFSQMQIEKQNSYDQFANVVLRLDEIPSEYFDYLKGTLVSYSCSASNETMIISCSILNTGGLSFYSNMTVKKLSNGWNDICSSAATTSSALLYCNLTSYGNGTYWYVVSVRTSEGNSYYIASGVLATSQGYNMGKNGLFLIAAIFFIMFMLGLQKSFEVGMMFGIIGLVAGCIIANEWVILLGGTVSIVLVMLIIIIRKGENIQ